MKKTLLNARGTPASFIWTKTWTARMILNTDATASPDAPPKKPRLALAIATAFGAGYIPKAAGTFGSLVGIAVAVLTHPVSLIMIIGLLFFHGGLGIDLPVVRGHTAPALLRIPSLAALATVGLLGVWSCSRVADYAGV